MKKLLLATVLTGLMTGSVALAIPTSGTIEAYQTPGLHQGNGGAFTATVLTPTTSTFYTFCIEEGITFNENQTYNYTLGATDHAGNDLAFGTALLFWMFANNQFTGSDVVNNDTQAGLLQQAIWLFQGQSGGAVTPYTTLAVTILAGFYNAYSQGYVAGNNAFDTQFLDGNQVDIIQLSQRDSKTGASYGQAQDWLVVTPRSVPDGGTTAILLGVGLLGIGLASRKFATTR